MEPKTIAKSQTSPMAPGERVMPDPEVWDPPFERWIRLADALLYAAAPPLPKAAIRRGLKTPPLKH